MAALRPVKVRCPACENHITVQPRVVGVRVEGRRLITALDVPPVQHDCAGRAVLPVGFAPPPQTDSGPRTTRQTHGLEPQGSIRPAVTTSEGGALDGSQE